MSGLPSDPDSGPVELVVNVTADPCPQASWFRRAPGDTVATEVSTETNDITVSCLVYCSCTCSCLSKILPV